MLYKKIDTARARIYNHIRFVFTKLIVYFF